MKQEFGIKAFADWIWEMFDDRSATSTSAIINNLNLWAELVGLPSLKAAFSSDSYEFDDEKEEHIACMLLLKQLAKTRWPSEKAMVTTLLNSVQPTKQWLYEFKASRALEYSSRSTMFYLNVVVLGLFCSMYMLNLISLGTGFGWFLLANFALYATSWFQKKDVNRRLEGLFGQPPQKKEV